MKNTNLNYLTTKLGVKYIFIESGEHAILNKIKEIGDSNLFKMFPFPNFWCELSWGSDPDIFDAAVDAFGLSPDEAISNCINLLFDLIEDQNETFVAIAKHFNIEIEK